MSDTRKYFKSVVSIIVLSEDKPWDGDLEWLSHDITEGHYVGYDFNTEQVEVTREQMIDLLYGAGSEPSFFDLDEEEN